MDVVQPKIFDPAQSISRKTSVMPGCADRGTMAKPTKNSVVYEKLNVPRPTLFSTRMLGTAGFWDKHLRTSKCKDFFTHFTVKKHPLTPAPCWPTSLTPTGPAEGNSPGYAFLL